MRRGTERWRFEQHSRAVRNRAEVSRGHLAAALSEPRGSGPLVVETLEQRLEKAIPGAWSVDGGPWVASESRWSVHRGGGRTLATGASQREAIERALFLWGAR